MTKKELVKSVAEDTGLTQKEIGTVLNSLVENVIVAVSEGDEITIPRLGKFVKTMCKGRKGVINFGERAGETYETEDRYVPKFKPAKEFKETVLAK